MGVMWPFAVTPCFLSEFAIEQQGHRKIRSRGKCLFVFLLLLFYFIDRVLPLSETYRHGWRKVKIATQSIHIMLCYFNGFVYMLSFFFPGPAFWYFMDNGYGLYGHYDLLENYNGYVYIFRACHWRLPAAYYLQGVAIQFVQFAKQNNQ